jgi:hypothetical protein
MKIKTNFTLFFLLFFSLVYSQEFKFGIKGGVNYNLIGTLFHNGEQNGGGANLTPPDDTNYAANKDMGYQAGFFINAKFDSFFLKSEINYTKLKNNYALAKETSYWESTRFDIPLLFGLNLSEPFSIYAGPVLNSISDTKLDGVETPFQFKKTATSISAGVLIDFRRFGIDIRYQYNISKTEEQRINIVRAKYGTNIAHMLEYNQSQILISAHINLITINANEKGHRIKSNWRGKPCF